MSALAALAPEFGPGMLVAALAAPLIVLALFLAPGLRAFARAITPLAPAPALAAAILAIGGAPVGAELPMLRVSLMLDEPGGMLLVAAALVWLVASIFALKDGADQSNADRFAVSWPSSACSRSRCRIFFCNLCQPWLNAFPISPKAVIKPR